MKTHPMTKQICCLITFVIIIFNSTESRAQQVITFKNWTEVKAFITYQTKDTVKYYVESKPGILYVETMDNIRRIIPFDSLTDKSDSLSYPQCRKKYSHYLHMTIGGPILFSSGGVLTGLGIAGLVSLADDEGYDELTKGAKAFCGIVTAVGVVGVIAGIAMTVSGVTNMQKYKEKLNGFSFDLHYTPQVKGISLVYRF
jgi:hypothetical protein